MSSGRRRSSFGAASLNGQAARRQCAIGVGALLLTAVPTAKLPLPELEVKVFDAINGLPDSLYRPVWPVMQLGALGAVPATAAVAALAGHQALAQRLLITGSTTWVLAKVIKRAVRRGRPSEFIPTHVRGQAASGHGFLSGHAGIATALAATALQTRPALRPWLAGLVATVGIARIYVGAHLPLDVLGGAALGLAVDGGLSWWSTAST